jgi:hypothetical protein
MSFHALLLLNTDSETRSGWHLKVYASSHVTLFQQGDKMGFSRKQVRCDITTNLFRFKVHMTHLF